MPITPDDSKHARITAQNDVPDFRALCDRIDACLKRPATDFHPCPTWHINVENVTHESIDAAIARYDLKGWQVEYRGQGHYSRYSPPQLRLTEK